MYKKKKKGSSMLMVLIVFAVIVTFGTAVLALTGSDYSMRLVASQKVKNTYYTDSGINVTEGIVNKVVEYAVKQGNEAVSAYLKNNAESDSSIFAADGSINNQQLYNNADNIFKNSYKTVVEAYLNSRTDTENLPEGKYINRDGDTDVNKSLYDGLADIPTLTIPSSLHFDSNNKINFKVTSTFNVTPKNGQTSNKKTVSANIMINTPDYSKAYYVSGNVINISNNPVWQNAISIDGNMRLNCDTEFDGDVFVKGSPASAEDILKNVVYTKYNGGIIIGNDDSNGITVNFNGANEVTTPSSFNINGSNKSVNLTGSLYAGNVYVGKSSNSAGVNDSSNDYINAQAIYTSNDLALNATKTTLNISQFYGINDITKPRGVDSASYSSSSSIIVNSSDIGNGSSINISNQAMILGTAYINTNPAYQTGEAVAIKGNYMAYNTPIPYSTGSSSDIQSLIETYNQNKVNFAYINPLVLFNSLKSNPTAELTSQQKMEYFKLCAKLGLSVGGQSLKETGISLPNDIINFGAAVSNGQLVDTHYSADDQSKILAKQQTFAGKVYEMGVDPNYYGTSSDSLYSDGHQNRDVMSSQQKDKQIEDGHQINTVDQVYFGDKTYQTSNLNRNNNTALYINNVDSDVYIVGRNADRSLIPNNAKIIDLDKNMSSPDSSSGIIIVKGNIHVLGTIDFTGSIIGGGNFDTLDNQPKKFRHDDNKMLAFVKNNYSLLKDIFVNGTNQQLVNDNFTIGEAESDTGYAIQSGIVKLNNWRLEQ